MKRNIYTDISFSQVKEYISKAYYITETLQQDIYYDKSLQKWLKLLGVLKNRIDAVYCPLCEEKRLSKLQEEILLEEISGEFDRITKNQEIIIKQYDYYSHQFCRRCMIDTSLDLDIDDDILIRYLRNTAYYNDKEIRSNLIKLISEAYFPNSNYATDFLNILLNELFDHKLALDEASEVLTTIYSGYYEISEGETQIVIEKFDHILDLLEHGSNSGIDILLSAFMMNNSQMIERWVDRLLDIITMEQNIQRYNHIHIFLSDHYPMKILDRLDLIKKVGIENVNYRLVLEKLVNISPNTVINEMDEILDALNGEYPEYSVYILDKLDQKNSNLLVPFKESIQRICNNIEYFDEKEVLEEILIGL